MDCRRLPELRPSLDTFMHPHTCRASLNYGIKFRVILLIFLCYIVTSVRLQPITCVTSALRHLVKLFKASHIRGFTATLMRRVLGYWDSLYPSFGLDRDRQGGERDLFLVYSWWDALLLLLLLLVVVVVVEVMVVVVVGPSAACGERVCRRGYGDPARSLQNSRQSKGEPRVAVASQVKQRTEEREWQDPSTVMVWQGVVGFPPGVKDARGDRRQVDKLPILEKCSLLLAGVLSG
ncbi:hypothetical protein E2C01_007443 [Portunus trituberculatus]|uniref:Uncharacterized protein n=1 Tax=Portunus trituberculatus TaxID=210409 RepID=A0A5B7CY80_PORTR|nr:hypothetical protein [Portunus trituberculatus]